MSNHTTLLPHPRKISDIRQELATPGVYAIYNTETDTYYIGQSQVVIKRINDHFDNLESGDHNNKILQREFDKFGEDSFVVDLLHDMPDSNDLERRRQETKEIQRFRNYHRRLYNKIMKTAKTKPNQASTKHASYPVKKNNPSPKMAQLYQREYDDSLTDDEPDYEDTGTCVDCGNVGIILVDAFYCDDNKIRCTSCLDKMLESWTIKFNDLDQRRIDRRSSQSYFRWQIDNRRYQKKEMATAISRFAEKHDQPPSVLYVNLNYNGPSEMGGIEVHRRRVTPKGCLDIPILPAS